MGNHLEPPNEGDWGRAIVASDFTDIAGVGFETIRLPVRWSNHAATTAPYTIDAVFMDRVEAVVDQARAAGLRVILNMHHYEDPQGNIFANPNGQKERFSMMWRQIAQRFQGKDAMVWFELLNEPHDQLTHANLLSVLEPGLDEVRATNPTRVVVWGGEGWSGTYSLDDIPIPDDPNIIVTFHSYEPFSFTHQGAPWISPVLPTGVTYGSAGDQAVLDADKARVQEFMDRTGRGIFLGEFGAYEEIPLAERVKYYAAIHEGYQDMNIDGCVWAYTNTMYFRDRDTNAWIPELLDAIGL
jgi:endoglucanase